MRGCCVALLCFEYVSGSGWIMVVVVLISSGHYLELEISRCSRDFVGSDRCVSLVAGL